jgi:hypothetical protein
LLEDVLIIANFRIVLPARHLGEKGFGIEPIIGELRHSNFLYSDECPA